MIEGRTTGAMQIEFSIKVVRIRRSWRRLFKSTVELHIPILDSPRSVLCEDDQLNISLNVNLEPKF